MQAEWTIDHHRPHGGITLRLCTVAELQNLKATAPDTQLMSILGDEKPARDCDDDSRWGFVAWGVPIYD